jgi:hypothetical protein
VALVTLVIIVSAGHAWLAQAAPPQTATMPNTTSPALASATPTGALGSGQSIALTFTLQPRNKAALEAYARAVATPHGQFFHHFLTPALFNNLFGPDPATLRALQDFAASSGLTITQQRSGGLFVDVTGTAGQIQSALHTQIKTYHNAKGETFFANAGNIALPTALAHSIVSVTGLDSVALHRPQITTPHKNTEALTKSPRTAAGCPSGIGQSSLTPSQIATAYDFPNALTGAGQTVALVEFDGYSAADISVYGSCFAPSTATGTVVTPRLVDLASPLTPSDGAIEDELDIELILGMAPAVSKIAVYEAPNTNGGLVDMLAAIANDDTAQTVSDSWGSCESDAGFSVAASEEIAFLQMAAQGQGVYVAAGDNGAYDCLGDLGTPPYAHGRAVNADDPASDPYVVAVGGTTLTVNATTSSYISETVWNNSTLSNQQLNGTGGGISQFWGAPAWQSSNQATSAPAGIADPGTARLLPDVTANADPQTGYAEYCTVGSSCQGAPAPWFDIGGTSAAAPLWATLAALAAEQATTRVGLITPALYSLLGADAAANHAAGVTLGSTTFYDYLTQVNGASPGSGTIVFNDITAGNNSFPSGQSFAPGFSAKTGYDAASGLGSMSATAIEQFLVNNLRFTTPHLYMAAVGNDKRIWLGGYYLNNDPANLLPDSPAATNWGPLGTQVFQGPAAIADNGVTTTGLSGAVGLVWVAGIGTDGVARIGAWNPSTTTFGGWIAAANTTLCQGHPALAYAQNKLLLTCETTAGGLSLDVYTPQSATWGGWQNIGGGLTDSPTMATDGTTLLMFAQTAQNDWFNTYTVGTATLGVWRHIPTTCEATPSVAFTGTPATYEISCIANDTSTLWSNVYSLTSNTLAGWINEDAPSGGLHNGTAISFDTTDSPGVTFFTGETKTNAMSVLIATDNPYFLFIFDWQQVSLPGIFTTGAATDYFGI